MLHVEVVGQFLAVPDEISDVLGSLLNVSGSLVLLRWIVEYTILQQVILEVGRVELTHESTVHVESRDAILLLDVVLRVGIGDVLNVSLQCGNRFTSVPFGEMVILDQTIVVSTTATAAEDADAEDDDWK
jgi:hypothetical protein